VCPPQQGSVTATTEDALAETIRVKAAVGRKMPSAREITCGAVLTVHSEVYQAAMDAGIFAESYFYLVLCDLSAAEALSNQRRDFG